MNVEKLRKLGACPEAIEWTEKQKNSAEAWTTCERGDWMLWLLGKLSGPAWGKKRKPLVLAACDCARLALPYVKKGEERPLKAIETAEAWTRGEATEEEVRDTAATAYAAYAATAYAAAAAYAAYAAAYAAYAAAAAAYAAYAAAAAAAAAAADTAYAAYADAAAARQKVLKQCADIVRKHYSKAPRL